MFGLQYSAVGESAQCNGLCSSIDCGGVQKVPAPVVHLVAMQCNSSSSARGSARGLCTLQFNNRLHGLSAVAAAGRSPLQGGHPP